MIKLLAARRVAVSACPYLATALHAMSIVPSYDVPTMGVDRYWRCYVSPAFVTLHDLPDLAYVWLHLALDLEINDDLLVCIAAADTEIEPRELTPHQPEDAVTPASLRHTALGE